MKTAGGGVDLEIPMEPSAPPPSPVSPGTGTAEKVDDLVKPSATGKPPTRADSDEPSAEQVEMPLPSDLRIAFQGGLFFLAFLAALYAAREIVLPVILAFVLLARL
jgi:hypothetical protein